MVYLIFAFGVLLGLFALYRFFIKASVDEIRVFLRITIGILYALVILAFALFGRILVSIGLLFLCLPVIFAYFRAKQKEKAVKKQADAAKDPAHITDKNHDNRGDNDAP